MEQEIFAQEETARRIQALFTGGSDASKTLAPFIAQWSPKDRESADAAMRRLLDEYDDERIRRHYFDLLVLPAWQRLPGRPQAPPERRLASGPFRSPRTTFAMQPSRSPFRAPAGSVPGRRR
jgi:hypothetical protein